MPPMVVPLKDLDGTLITTPQQFATAFQQYYTTLYASQVTQTPEETKEYLQKIQFLRLGEEQVALLEALVTVDITTAMLQLASSKAPGSDGLPLEFFTYSKALTAKLQLNLYRSIFYTATLPCSTCMKPKS